MTASSSHELAASGADAVVLTPAHQYPTGVVMTPERRSALIAWARDCGALIVEDDYDAEYRYDRDPVASLQGLAPIASPSSGRPPRRWRRPCGSAGSFRRRPARRGRAADPRDRDDAADPRSAGPGLVHRRRRTRPSPAPDAQALPRQARQPDAGAGATAARGAGQWRRRRPSPHGLAPGGIRRARRGDRGRAPRASACTSSTCIARRTRRVPPALLLGYALPTEIEVQTGVRLLAQAVG